MKAPRAADGRARESREGGKHPEKESRAGTEARGVGRTSSSWVSCARARVMMARGRAWRAGTRARKLAGATAAPKPGVRVVIAAKRRRLGAVHSWRR